MFCPQCGSPLADHARFCLYCGYRFQHVSGARDGAGASAAESVAPASPVAPMPATPPSAPAPKPAVSTTPTRDSARTEAVSPSTSSVSSDRSASSDGHPRPMSERPSSTTPAPKAPASRGADGPSTSEAVHQLVSDVVDTGVNIHNTKVNALCVVFGPIYTIGGLWLLTQPDVNPIAGVLAAAYGIWLVTGIFTKGWRIVIY